MPRPDFEEVIKKLDQYSRDLLDNQRYGESKLVLAFAEMVRVMGWSSVQADTNNIQIANLTDEIKDLKSELATYAKSAKTESRSMRYLTYALGAVAFLQLLVGIEQIYLAKIQVAPILHDQRRYEIGKYEFCKEPGNWDITDGGATPDSTCKSEYLNLRAKYGEYAPAEKVLTTESIHK